MVLRHSADWDAVQTKTSDSMTSPIGLRWGTMNNPDSIFPQLGGRHRACSLRSRCSPSWSLAGFGWACRRSAPKGIIGMARLLARAL